VIILEKGAFEELPEEIKEEIKGRRKLIRDLEPYDVSEPILDECIDFDLISPDKKRIGRERYKCTFSRKDIYIIITCCALWEMGIEKSERDQLLKGCSLKDVKEVQRKIKDSSYLQFLDFLKNKKVVLERREGLRKFLTFKLP